MRDNKISRLLSFINILISPFSDCPANRGSPCLSNGTKVLSEYGYNEENFWWDMTGLLLLTILMNIIAYLGTRRRRMSRPIAY